LLRERPVEARIDPDFVELAEGEDRELFHRVFSRWIHEKLETPSPTMRRVLARSKLIEIERSPIRALENAAWCLVEWRDHRAPWPGNDFDRGEAIAQLLERITAIRENADAQNARVLSQVDAHDDDIREGRLVDLLKEFGKKDRRDPDWKAPLVADLGAFAEKA